MKFLLKVFLFIMAGWLSLPALAQLDAEKEKYYIDRIKELRKQKYINGDWNRETYDVFLMFEGVRIQPPPTSLGRITIGRNEPEYVKEFHKTCEQFAEVKKFVAKHYTEANFKKNPDSFNQLNLDFYKKYALPFMRTFAEYKADITFCNIRQDLLPFISERLRTLYKGTKYEPFYHWFLQHQHDVTAYITYRKYNFSDSKYLEKGKKPIYYKVNENWEL